MDSTAISQTALQDARLLVLGVPIAILLYSIVYVLYLDPLRKIPGPWYTRISSFWLAFQARFCRRSTKTHELHQKYGDILRLGSNYVSINKLEALSDIHLQDKHFRKGPWYDAFLQPQAPGLLVSYDSVDHSQQRRNVSAAFSPKSLRDFETEMNNIYRKWKNTLLQLIPNDQSAEKSEVNLLPPINHLAFDLIGSFTYGTPFGFLDKGYDFLEFLPMFEHRLNATTALGTLPAWARWLVVRMPFDGNFWRASATSLIKLRKITAKSLDARIKSGSKEKKDILTYMLNAKSEGGASVPYERMITHAAAFVIAGSDSTAASICHFIDFVARPKHADVRKRIQAEIDAMFPSQPSEDWIPQYTECLKLDYTIAVMYEVLRLRPTAAQGMERYALSKTLEYDGYTIPPGTVISVPTYTLHRKESIFPDAETFKPERWLAYADESEEEARERVGMQKEAFNIFSQGPRNCIGQNFAWMEMLKSVTLLMKCFEVEREDGRSTELSEGFFLEMRECEVRMGRKS